jgi:predicted Rossmann-fold nucleotide-binding protein
VPELLEGYERGKPETIEQTLDARIYKYYTTRHSFESRPPVIETLACRIHDHAIDRALDNLLRPDDASELNVVGIMGGHKLRRDDPGFLNVARIARRLTRSGLFVATGGGPGAMEAGNMGAWFANSDEAALESAVEILRHDPWYLDPHYLDRGYDVLDKKPTGESSLAIPTWFYGHEPSNLFSTSIAKYFANSIREDGLLTIATYGIIFSPGSAGTIQEIFQDAAQNHYNSVGVVSPMVFLGVDFWSDYRPVFPLIESMSSGKLYHEMILITDDAQEAVEFISNHPPRADW